MKRRLLAVGLLWWGLLGLSMAQAPVFRVGILDAEDGSLSHGALLAIETINAAGGVRGADGTLFRLEPVLQPADTLVNSAANIRQAAVIAVIGPSDSGTVLGNLATLQGIGVPILTPATDDTIPVLDASGLLLRSRAQELLRGRALADYIINDLGLRSIATVQLDLQSTAGMVGFTTALAGFGVAPLRSFLFDGSQTIEQLAAQIASTNAQALVIYGEPNAVAPLYGQLRALEYGGVVAYNQANSAAFRELVPRALLTDMLSTATWSYAASDAASVDFLARYVRAYGEVPDELAAAGYDSVTMLAAAIAQPGALLTNLRALGNVAGVQGLLNPVQLPQGESSDNVFVTTLGTFGAPQVAARYIGGQRALDGVAAQPATPQPLPSPTPQGVYVVITRQVQNVRLGPGTNYDVLGQLKEGETAQVIGGSVNLDWVVVNFRGQNGWLSTDILELNGDTRTVPVVAAPPTPTPLPATATPTASPIADIAIVSALPTRLTLGVPFTVTVTVVNQGQLAAGNFAIASTFLPGGVYAGVNVPSLLPGQQTTVNLTGTLTGATGPQSVTIVADLNNEVDEGPGEGNNTAYTYTYVADAPLLVGTAIGSLTVANGGTITLDGGTPDVQWNAGGLVPLGGTQLAVLTTFANFDLVHYDALVGAAYSGSSIPTVTSGQLIAIKTDGGAKYGIVQITSAVAGGNVTLNFRMYN